MNWIDLEIEIETWLKEGLLPSFWWRDDDACEPHPNLDRILELSSKFSIPLGLATVPKTMLNSTHLETFVKQISNHAYCEVLQHGFQHRNYEPTGGSASEFGANRSVESIKADIANGKLILEKYLSEKFIPVFVPPWNQISPIGIEALAECGFVGLSTFASYSNLSEKDPGFKTIKINNCQCDFLKWKKPKPSFRGPKKVITELVEHLQARRKGQFEILDSTGFLTHHLDHTQECWDFLAQLFEFSNKLSKQLWQKPRDVFRIKAKG